jgi:hypothetical protein
MTLLCFLVFWKSWYEKDAPIWTVALSIFALILDTSALLYIERTLECLNCA